MKFIAILITFIISTNVMAEKSLRLIMYKVFHGDMMLLSLPNGKQMVIDAGYNGKPIKFLFPTLEKEKIRRIDYLVLTHNDGDHIGGAAEIMEHYEVGEVWNNGRPKYNKYFKRYRDIAKRKGIPVKTVTAGEIKGGANSFYIDDSVKIEVINPSNKSVYNNDSMVFRLTWRKFSMLFASEIQRAGQRTVMEYFKPYLKARAYKVTHHGGGVVKGFHDAINPEVSLCPCFHIPPGIPFIYPSPFTIFDLKRRSRYFSVRKTGSIEMTTDGCKIDVKEYEL